MGGLLLNKEKLEKPKYNTTPVPLTDFEEVPIPPYQFSIEFGTVTVALFQSIETLEVKREVVPLTEGGLNAYTYEFPGQVSFGHVTFKTGMTSSDFFWQWMMDGQIAGWVQPKDFSLYQRRPVENQYKIVRRWDFFNAFPVKWNISSLESDKSDKIVIESLELSFDYFMAGPAEKKA
jgi:phage tail-like protein